jgi:hypothetical protein
VELSHVTIQDSLSDGLSVVAPGSPKAEGTIARVRLDHVNITTYGIGAPARHGLWIRGDASGSLAISHSQIAELQNDSTNLTIIQE